jgi:LPXTG-motif cell wall-anchored protein
MPVAWDEVLSAATETGIDLAVTTGSSLITQGASGRGMYPECGEKPFWIGKRRNAYNACVANAQQRQSLITPTGAQTGNKNLPLIIAIGAGVLIGGYFILKK